MKGTLKLELHKFPVKRIVVGEGTRYDCGELLIDLDEIRHRVLDDKYFDDVNVHVAYPGESVRIIHLVDVVEPRFKVFGSGCVFPGIVGPSIQVGDGVTSCLDGMTVMSSVLPAMGESYYWREAIVDMAGLGAMYTQFSKTVNLVLEFSLKEPGASISPLDLEMVNTIRGSKYSQEFNLALRRGQLALASYLAETVKGMDPENVTQYELTTVDKSLPKVLFGCQILGDLVYGAQMGWQPTLIHPNELFDGAMLRPFNTPACIRQTAYNYQNNHVINQLFRHHGTTINFLGVLLIPAGPDSLIEKERSASLSVKLMALLGTDGVVISWLGAGHMGVEAMLLVRDCERIGIKTTLLNPEMAKNLDDTGFVHFVEEADAIVSTGNYEETICLPAVEKVIGGHKILVSDDDAGSEVVLGVNSILGSTHTFGPNKLNGVAF